MIRALGWIIALPLAALYGVLVHTRLALYRRGWKRAIALGIPTVAVGNLTAGGTGKTPVVSWLLTEARAAGISSACLTRGYGRRTKTTLSRIRVTDGSLPDPLAVGDEVAMLAAMHPDVAFFVSPDRVASAHLARLTDAPHLLVMDDGYQHLRVRRDLNVLLVDAQARFGNGHVLPWGPLREPLSEVRRADVVLLTKSNLGDPDTAISELRALGVGTPIFRCDYLATKVVRLDGAEMLPVSVLQGRSVNLLCGIARPDAFRATVTGLGAAIAQMEIHPDHHPYPEEDLQRLESRRIGGSRNSSPGDADWWLTTEKDAVKLRGRLAPDAAKRVWVVTMEAVPEPAARAFFLDTLRALTLH